MDSWKSVDLHGAARIRRVVDVFEITENTKVPYGKFKIKVLEDASGEFIAVPNVAYKKIDGEPEWVSGLGRTAAGALQDALRYFMDSLPEESLCEESAFEWSAPEDF